MSENEQLSTDEDCAAGHPSEELEDNPRERDLEFIDQRYTKLRPRETPSGGQEQTPGSGQGDEEGDQSATPPPPGSHQEKLEEYRRRHQSSQE